MMQSDEIRSSFLRFFEGKNHKVIPSSSLIPHGDPTLLLTTAGMVQVKPYFLGISTPPSLRLASCQKCFRTTDIDAVGDTKHLTFFEMLGNFSVGNYFKSEAINWAWEFIVDVLNIDPDRLWVTIFLDDDQAYDIWQGIGFPKNRILRFGEKDNFWGPAGDSGPCGPCSEIHYDFGVNCGCGKPDCNPSCGCGRFLEIWNLVFTEYLRDKSGKQELLPKPNIDTGMGLERVSAVKQGVSTVYDTDLFLPIRNEVTKIAGIEYGESDDLDNAIRIVTEHGRGIPFLIADGVLPSNEGRGYILRRILRRASYFGRKLGIDEPFLFNIADCVIKKMSYVYPELANNGKFILELVEAEEEKFAATLDKGINILENLIRDALSKGKNVLAGEDIFRLYDTYGFPVELTSEIAIRNNLITDMDKFENEMSKQKEKARSTQKFTADTLRQVSLTDLAKTQFSGYQELESDVEILYIIEQKSGQSIETADAQSEVAVILDRTPFYAEMGGQVGDTGMIITESYKLVVTNTILSPYSFLGEGYYIHLAVVSDGVVRRGSKAKAIVDIERRFDIERNHTATHLLQLGLRNILGSHVYQRGSLVAPDRLRFDFSHLKTLEQKEIDDVQSYVNELIRRNLYVSSDLISYQDAIANGAMAIFEEKYGDRVRVLCVGNPPVSMELCGGTHVKATGEIGLFIIVSESSIGTGLRRIEAVTGRGAEKYVKSCQEQLRQISQLTGVKVSDVVSKVQSIIEKSNIDLKAIDSLRKEMALGKIAEIEKRKVEINGINLISEIIPDMSLSNLREIGDRLRDKMISAIIVLGSVFESKPCIIVMLTKDMVSKGVDAGEIAKKIAQIMGGSGGGKKDMAQAGGKYVEKLPEALKETIKIVEGL